MYNEKTQIHFLFLRTGARIQLSKVWNTYPCNDKIDYGRAAITEKTGLLESNRELYTYMRAILYGHPGDS